MKYMQHIKLYFLSLDKLHLSSPDRMRWSERSTTGREASWASHKAVACGKFRNRGNLELSETQKLRQPSELVDEAR